LGYLPTCSFASPPVWLLSTSCFFGPRRRVSLTPLSPPYSTRTSPFWLLFRNLDSLFILNIFSISRFIFSAPSRIFVFTFAPTCHRQSFFSSHLSVLFPYVPPVQNILDSFLAGLVLTHNNHSVVCGAFFFFAPFPPIRSEDPASGVTQFSFARSCGSSARTLVISHLVRQLTERLNFLLPASAKALTPASP